MRAEEILYIALKAAMFASVLALGLSATPSDVRYLWHHPGLLARSFVSMYVVIPVVTVLALALPLPLGLKIGLTLLAISPPLTSSGGHMLALGGRPPYVYSLLFTTSLLAVITVPLSLAILTALPLAADASVPPLRVATLVMMTFLLPLAVGALLGHLWPRFAGQISGRLNALAGQVILATLIGLLLVNLSLVRTIGMLDYPVIVCLTLVALGVGYWLGGPDPGDRASLAVAVAERHTGVAALIAALNFPDRRAMVMVVIYKIVTMLVMLPYAKWCKKRLAARSASSPAAHLSHPEEMTS